MLTVSSWSKLCFVICNKV